MKCFCGIPSVFSNLGRHFKMKHNNSSEICDETSTTKANRSSRKLEKRQTSKSKPEMPKKRVKATLNAKQKADEESDEYQHIQDVNKTEQTTETIDNATEKHLNVGEMTQVLVDSGNRQAARASTAKLHKSPLFILPETTNIAKKVVPTRKSERISNLISSAGKNERAYTGNSSENDSITTILHQIGQKVKLKSGFFIFLIFF